MRAARSKNPSTDLRDGDASTLPWAAGSFDRVLCVNALHHFSDKVAFVGEAGRVLTDGGGLITFGLDPHVGNDRWVIYDMFDGTLATDQRRYPPIDTIWAWMAAAGFTRTETFVAMHASRQRPARDALADGYLDRTATSQLTLLSDVDYRNGIARIERQIQAAEKRGDTFEIGSDLRVYATVGWLP
ncbi:hypothetical protein BH23ACT10_BH23ACT10_29910 [soil metagenome]